MISGPGVMAERWDIRGVAGCPSDHKEVLGNMKPGDHGRHLGKGRHDNAGGAEVYGNMRTGDRGFAQGYECERLAGDALGDQEYAQGPGLARSLGDPLHSEPG